MYFLIVKQIQATKKENLEVSQLYQRKQKTFLCSHLARWLPQFAGNVQKNAQTQFYKRLARLTEMFVEMDINACYLLCTGQSDSMRS